MTNDISRFDNLRHRPFLVINVSFHPAKGVRTERKGWKTDKNNIALQEHPQLVDRISNRILREATVIIDIISESVIKNRIRMSLDTVDPETLDAQVLQHFMGKYHDLIQQGRNSWWNSFTPGELYAMKHAQAL